MRKPAGRPRALDARLQARSIDAVKIDPRFAKVNVWERGYFYEPANAETYENATSAIFVMEKQLDGRRLILAHEASSVGIPVSKRTNRLDAKTSP